MRFKLEVNVLPDISELELHCILLIKTYVKMIYGYLKNMN